MKTFALIACEATPGSINIPVTGAMTNAEMGRRIEMKYIADNSVLFDNEETGLMLEYCNGLDNDEVFIDPCDCEDEIVLSFGIINE